MDLITYLYLFVLAFDLFLALLIFFQRIGDIRNLIYGLLCVSTIIWIYTALLTDLSTSTEEAISWARLTIVGPSFIPVLFFLFSKVFPRRKTISILQGVLYLLIPFIFLVFLQTDYNIKAVAIESWGVTVEGGVMYYFLFIYYFIFFGLALRNLYRSYNKEDGKLKSQIKYILIGVSVTLAISLITNIVLVIYRDNGASLLGPPSSIFFLATTGYAILKYQFLDIRVLVGRITYYSMFMILFIISYYAIYVFDQKIFGGAFTWGAFVSGLVIAAFFSFFFVKFNDYLRVQVRTRIINPGYDPLEVLDVLSRKAASLLDINKIIDVSIEALDQTVRADYEGLIVMPTDKRQREFVYESTKKSKGLDLELFSELNHIWNDIGNIPIVYQEIEYEMPEKLQSYTVVVEKIFKYMGQKNIRLILPLRESDKNPGMLILGQKESDGMYTMQDIEFVQGVATTIGLAMTRAFYYLEAQDLNVNLQRRVDEATKELQFKNRRLEKAMKKIEDIRQQERDMIDVMGHELRTPITIVRNALLVLLSKIKGKKEVKVVDIKEYVEKALESARREINLVETLLSATKVESNRIQMNLTKIDMIDVVEDSLDAHKDIAKDKKIKINFIKPKKKVWGYADRTRIQEVMDNFLSNAVKYTLRGEVKIWIDTSKKHAQISIQDTGIGISEEDISRLGKKFFRAKQYLKDDDGDTNGVVRPGGTGLGLYVSFNLIRIMQGHVKVTSKIGKGSVFSFSIPVYTNQPDRHVDQTFEEEI